MPNIMSVRKFQARMATRLALCLKYILLHLAQQLDQEFFE